MSTMNAGAEQALAAHAQSQAAYRADLQVVEGRRDKLQRVVDDNANPHPAFVLAVFVLVLLAVFVVYCLSLKPNASGEWVDDVGNKWVIDQSCFADTTATFNGDPVEIEINHNMVKSHNMIGIWNYDDDIILVGGGNLTRVN